jgi:hypothetical protein
MEKYDFCGQLVSRGYGKISQFVAVPLKIHRNQDLSYLLHGVPP